MTTPKIDLYSTTTCPYCIAAKRLLQAKGVEWNEIKVDQQPEQRAEMMERSGRRTVPQIFIGDTHVGGFDDMAALEHAGELDALLGL